MIKLKTTCFACFLMLLIAISCSDKENRKKYVLVIHGGAGTIERASMTPEKEIAYKQVLEEAVQVGYQAIQAGKSAVDAVEATVHVMENSPLFNAGKGAVFTHEGRNELDAAIMDGRNLMAGAIAGVTRVRNPISAARAVMEKSEHVLLSGSGADSFAEQAGLEMVDPSYFYTKDRWDGLQRALELDSVEAAQERKNHQASSLNAQMIDRKFGTVGCVALDNKGDLAAGTSTGGMTNKKFGRIGDAPIIGAGTYANNESVAVSCTGWGEFYLRNVVAYDLAALMSYKSLTVQEAAARVLKKVETAGGNGGLIALDKHGNMTMSFNTTGMYRAAITDDGKVEVYIYEDE